MGFCIRTTLILSMLLLSSCAFNEQANVNKMIAQSNSDRYTSFVNGMNAATSSEARIAIAMGFSNPNDQKFYRETTVLDYVKGVGSLVNPWMPYFFSGNSEDTQSMSAGRDIIYQGVRADSTWQSNSMSQEYTADGSSISSNDQETYMEQATE